MAKDITEATINDIYPQYKLLRKAKEGFGYPTKEHNAEKAIDQLSLCASQGLNWIAKEEGKIVGCMVLCYDQLWFSDENFLVNIVYYVDDKHRRSSLAIKLLDTAKKIAKELGLPLYIGVTYGTDVERKEKFFLRKGFEKIGGNYLLR